MFRVGERVPGYSPNIAVKLGSMRQERFIKLDCFECTQLIEIRKYLKFSSKGFRIAQ